MSALEAAARALRGAFGESRALTTSDPWAIPAPGDLRANASAAGVPVSTDSALGQITFYRGVQILSDAVSSLPVNGIKTDSAGNRTTMLEPPRALTDPFVGLNLREGMSQIVTSLAIRGNAYLVAVEWADDYYLVPTRWRILHPDQVTVRWGADGEREYVINRRLWQHQVMHLTAFMLPGAVKGAGLIEYVRNALGLGLALDNVASEFFRNGVMSSGVIGVDAELSPDDAKAIAQQFKQNHSGVNRAHLPIVMGGGAKYTPISLTPEDAQFIESRQFHAGQIATLLGIPPHLLGLVDKTTSWGSGIEVQGRAFVDYTLAGYIQRFEEMFTLWTGRGIDAELDTDRLTRATTKERFEQYGLALGQGGGVAFMCVDEIRAKEGLAPLPGGAGQIFYVGSQMTASADQNGPVQATTDDETDDQAGDDSDSDPTAEDRARAAAEVVQKVYLGVGPVLTSDEARDLVRRAGADLTGSLPPKPTPAAPSDPETDAGSGDDDQET